MEKMICSIWLAMLLGIGASAKTFHLVATQGSRPFSLRISCTSEGKAAFVQYDGQEKLMALRLQKFTTSVTSAKNKPTTFFYQWEELLNGKVNGIYTITEQFGSVIDASYIRNRDKRKFKLVAAKRDPSLDQMQKYLLNGVLISFTWTTMDDQFNFTYPDGKVVSHNYLSLDAPDQKRRCYIKDYNFDGYDDLAFSVADAGMGVYQEFNIFIYQPTNKRFEPLKQPADQRAKCAGLSDVTVDAKQKLLYTACRGGARWWQDVYRLGKNNQLIWLRSEEIK